MVKSAIPRTWQAIQAVYTLEKQPCLQCREWVWRAGARRMLKRQMTGEQRHLWRDEDGQQKAGRKQAGEIFSDTREGHRAGSMGCVREQWQSYCTWHQRLGGNAPELLRFPLGCKITLAFVSLSVFKSFLLSRVLSVSRNKLLFRFSEHYSIELGSQWEQLIAAHANRTFSRGRGWGWGIVRCSSVVSGGSS